MGIACCAGFVCSGRQMRKRQLRSRAQGERHPLLLPWRGPKLFFLPRRQADARCTLLSQNSRGVGGVGQTDTDAVSCRQNFIVG